MSLGSRYNPEDVEKKWYSTWESSGLFNSKPDGRESFTILIPPPNVTGVLHMGHMLNNTIQDVLIRKARMQGLNACWVPGMDHASIATEAKVVRQLREKGIKKSDLSRDEFLKHAWDWTDNYGGIILQQLKRLGASPDWDRTAFTMDETRYDAVIKAFIDLYNAGKLYRGLRMVNWDPEAKTVLSNEEVLYKEENSKLYYIKYRFESSDDYITIATTRPETLLGDTAVAVHPGDEKYTHLNDTRLLVPLLNRSIPLIRDEYVDMEFGTGALKVTPAHDPNDYDLGKKHNLEVIDIFNDDGSLAETAEIFIGMDRFEARKAIVAELKNQDLLVKTEDIRNNVGRSERTNCVVEPKLSLQWYVDMKSLAEPALKAVESGEIKFHPEKYINTYKHWMNNIRDWCISRQLWWGHRIPAYYYEDNIYVAATKEEAYEQALNDFPELKAEQLRQDEDVLDTWFSSWLWPISVFDGFNKRDELDYYYPTSVLVTGWDIIFLWVARMIMAGYEWEGKRPFNHVYFTGMVRDSQRRKMSKSLGNSPDALKLIDEYGADSVRFGMLSCSPAGGDLLFDMKLVENGRNFCNKIWNAARLIKGWKLDQNKQQAKENAFAALWMQNKIENLIEGLDAQYSQFRISDCLMNLYSFIWNDFFSWYLEIIKPSDGMIDSVTLEECTTLYEQLCSLLHPFMPFITEEVYQLLRDGRYGNQMCATQNYPQMSKAPDSDLLSDFELLMSVVSNIRDVRNKNQLKPKEEAKVLFTSNNEIDRAMSRSGFSDVIRKLAYVSEFRLKSDDEESRGFTFISGKTKFFAEFEIELNVEEELVKLEEELKYQQGFLNSVDKKLSNERFVNNAPAVVVEKEKKKQSDALARIEALKERIASLKA